MIHVPMYEFENALQKIKWDMVGISEMRREGEEMMKRKAKIISILLGMVEVIDFKFFFVILWFN